ncbi:MAG: ureidoglycolate lyase [Gammaproteobacteria bacterium]
MTQHAPQYLFDTAHKPAHPHFAVPLVVATDAALDGYGRLIDDPEQCEIEIVRWPALGWRPVDADSGDEGGTTEGIFQGTWQGDVLMGRNDAVNGEYVLGWSSRSQHDAGGRREHVLLWHLNYHPDGGQLFFPVDKAPFVVPLALPGDDLQPEQVVAFWFDGSRGLYIHPNVWHEGVFPVTGDQRFYGRQGKVHARVSCDIGEEFGVYLRVPLVIRP